MGVDIYAQADFSRVARKRLSLRPELAFEAIERAIRQVLVDPIDARALRVGEADQESRLDVTLNPLTEPLSFVWQPTGMVQVETKTSILGAGYHLFVLELLLAIARDAGVTWKCVDDDDRFMLELEACRDWNAIEKEMFAWLRKLGQVLRDQPVDVCSLVNMPLTGWQPFGRAGIATPVGVLDRAWIESVALGNDLASRGAELWIWPTPERHAVFWRRYGEALMWSEIRWHVPADDAERELCELALACFARAEDLDPDIVLPAAEITELRSMLDEDASDGMPPAADGIGYARGLGHHTLGGGWSIAVPGYYYSFTEDDGSVRGFAFGTRSIRFSSIRIRVKDGRAPTAEELWARCVHEPMPGQCLETSAAKRRRMYLNTGHDEELGSDYFILTAEFRVDGGMGYTTITFEDAADQEWALSVVDSIKYSAPDRNTG